jgi:hypothetical protein
LKPAGIDNIYTFDINKSRTSLLYGKTTPWIITNAMDIWEDFDMNNNEHIQIPFGEYILKPGCYGNGISPIKYTSGLYRYQMIRNMLDKCYINFDDILQIKAENHHYKHKMF